MQSARKTEKIMGRTADEWRLLLEARRLIGLDARERAMVDLCIEVLVAFEGEHGSAAGRSRSISESPPESSRKVVESVLEKKLDQQQRWLDDKIPAYMKAAVTGFQADFFEQMSAQYRREKARMEALQNTVESLAGAITGPIQTITRKIDMLTTTVSKLEAKVSELEMRQSNLSPGRLNLAMTPSSSGTLPHAPMGQVTPRGGGNDSPRWAPPQSERLDDMVRASDKLRQYVGEDPASSDSE